jgi:hypothetical protein
MRQLQRPPHREPRRHPHRHRRRSHDRRDDPLPQQHPARPRTQLSNQPPLILGPPIRRRVRTRIPVHITERLHLDGTRIQHDLVIGQRVPSGLIGQQPPPPRRPAHLNGLQH